MKPADTRRNMWARLAAWWALWGGIGGYVLPVLFGLMNDIGVWQSCFMLLFGIAALSFVWMHVSIRAMEKGVYGVELKKLPELPEMQEIHGPRQAGVLGPHLIEDWSFAVWMVWSVVVAKLPAIGFTYSTDQLFWLAALPGLSGATTRIERPRSAWNSMAAPERG